jgi:hypothetical protein
MMIRTINFTLTDEEAAFKNRQYAFQEHMRRRSNLLEYEKYAFTYGNGW